MPFTITIEKPTGEEAIAELIRVAKFYERFEGAAGVQTPDEAPAPEPVWAPFYAPAPSPAAESPAPAAAEPPAPPPPPPPAATTLEGEALRVKIRTVLTPLMKTDKAGAARALVRKYGESISDVPDDKLADLLTESEAL